MRRVALTSVSFPTCLALLASLLVTVMAAPAQAQTPSFSDIAGNAHEDNILRLTATTPPIAGGYPDGTFRPSNTVTRGQMASFLARRLGLPTNPRDTGFSDVPPGYTHAGAIASLVEQGITTGYADGTFRPNASISREHMAVFLERGFRELLGPGGSAEAFIDVERYQTEIGAIVAARITEGATATAYRPDQPVRRDQMASFIARTLDLGAVPTGASCAPGSGVTSSTIGTALQGVILNHAVEHGGRVYAFSMDSSPSRIFVWDPESDELVDEIPFPSGAGQRTWATEVVGSTLYIGQDMVSGPDNLFALDLTDPNARPVPFARVRTNDPGDTGGDFWDLTSDDDGILWAATRAQETVHRIDPQVASPGQRVQEIRFEHVGYEGRHEVTSLVEDDGVLLAGLRGRATGGGVRLLEIDPNDLGDDQVAATRDLTVWGPGSNRLRGQGVYAMAIDEDQLLLGLQSSDTAPASFVRFERQPEGDPDPDGEPDERRPFEPEPAQVVPIPEEGAVTTFLRIDGEDRFLVAGNASGYVHRVAPSGRVDRIAQPVPNAPVRQLLGGFSQPVGVSSTADLWRLNSTETNTGYTVTNLIDDLGVSRDAPIRPHSVGLVAQRLVSGGNNILQSRPATGGAPTWSPVSGEAKAMTTDGRHAYVATYPKGQLWRFDPTADPDAAVELVADWDDAENRPWGIAWDERRRRVIVTTQSDYRDHGTVYAIDPARPEGRREVWGNTGAAGTDVSSRHGRAVAVVGDRVLVGSNGNNPTLAILDAETGQRQALVAPANGLGNIQAIVGDGSRAHLLTANGWWVVVNAQTGAVYRQHRILPGTNAGDLVLQDGVLHAASSNRLVTVDARTAQVRQIATPTAALSHLNQRNVVRLTGGGTDCGAYVMRGTDLVRYRYQPWTGR